MTAFADILYSMSPRELLIKLKGIKGKDPLTEFIYQHLQNKWEQSMNNIENNMVEGFKALSKEQASHQKKDIIITTLIQ